MTGTSGKVLVATAALVGALVGGAAAQQTTATTPATPPAPPRRVEPVIVTATKVETKQAETGATTSVITADDLRTYNYTVVEEALRRVPGVEIQRSGSLGKTTSISIRGAGPQQVVVLVDGVRVSSPTLGTADLSNIALDDVDRIEVVRGPQSTLYGADAIGGVVNVITKKGQGPPQGTVEFGGGSYRTFQERASLSGAAGRFSYSLGVSHLESNGRFDNDQTDRQAVVGKLGFTFPWHGELTLAGRYTDLDLELPVFSTNPTVFDPNSQSDTEEASYDLSYRQTVGTWWDVTARVGQWWNHSNFRNLPPPGTTTTISNIDTKRTEVELINTFTPVKWNGLTLGVEHRDESGVNAHAFDESIAVTAVYAQDEIRLFDRLFVGGGVRWEDNSVFGDELTPRVSAAFVVKETGSRLHAAWGHGFRAPTINDLFFPGFGNPALRPEFSESYEVGFDQKLWRNRLRFGATYAHMQFQDLIQFELQPSGAFIPVNVGRAVTDTVESYAELDPLDWLTLYVNYTHNDTENLATGLPLRRLAPHRWNAGVVVTPVERLSLFAQAYVASSQFEAEGQPRNPGYHRIDVGGTWRLWGRAGVMERLELFARIDNVTDERYDEVSGFRALGLNAFAGLRAHFR
jgi:vitamin B12 transporter